MRYFETLAPKGIFVAQCGANNSPHTVLYDPDHHVFASLGIRPSTTQWNELRFKTKAAFEGYDFSICGKPSRYLSIRPIKPKKVTRYLSGILYNSPVVFKFNVSVLYTMLEIRHSIFRYFRLTPDGSHFVFEDFEYCYGEIKNTGTVNGYIPEYQWYSTKAVYDLITVNLLKCDVELLSNSIRVSSKSSNKPFAYVLAQHGSIE